MAINYFEQFVAPGIERNMRTRQLDMAENQIRYDREQQERQRASNEAFAKDFGAAWESGNAASLASLIGKHPRNAEQILGAIGIKDKQQRTMTGNVAKQLSASISSGNTNGALSVVQSNADFLRSIGQDPDELASEIQTDPQSVARGAESMMLLTMTPDQLIEYQQKQEDRQLRRDQMAVQMRGQDITARGQDISAGIAAADRELRRLENEQKYIDRQLARETNELKRQEMQQKMNLAAEKADGIRREKAAAGEAAISTFDRSIQTIDEILADPALPSAVGIKSPTSYLPGSDAQTVKAKIETLKSQSFLNEVEKMKGLGALTEAEGQRLVSAIGSLDRDMPEKAFIAELNKIKGYMTSRKEEAAKKYGIQQPSQQQKSASAPQAAVDYLRSNPQLKAEFKQKYGYLPEGM